MAGTSEQLSLHDRRSVIMEAIQRINDQGWLPDSPGVSHGNERFLCAGAWVVRCAVARLRSEDDAQAFEADLLATGNRKLMLKTAHEIGLPVDIVEDAVRVNDTASDTRLRAVLTYLSGSDTLPHLA